jgi:hypothetical protein
MAVTVTHAPTRGRDLAAAAVIIAASIATTLWHGLHRGQDLNWDQRNYHIGVPWLLEHGTFWRSVAPAGIQSYYNPYVIQLEYLGIQHLPPLAFVIVLAIAQSAAFVIAGWMCLQIARARDAASDTGVKAGLWPALCGFALCLMAPVALSEAGTTFIDLLTAAPVLAAYALLLARDRSPKLITAGLAAGALIGLATALKLTNAVFALGAIGFALAGADSLRQRLAWLTAYGAGASAAFLAVGGAWQFELWQRFKNPLFPYYNNVFHSPDFGAGGVLRDERFLPHSLFDIWRYPLYWLLGGSPNKTLGSPTAELHFIDARWVIVTFGAVAFLAALALLPRWRKARLADPATGLLFAVLIAYLAWLGQFAIHRYMAPIDILCGAAVLVLALRIPWPAVRLGVLGTAAFTAGLMMVVPDWGHHSWQRQWQGIKAPPLNFGGPSIVFLASKPMSYVAASLPADAIYVGVSGDFDLSASADTALTRTLKQALAAFPTARLKEVDQGSPSDAMLKSYGLVVTANCEPLKMPDETLRICDVERAR